MVAVDCCRVAISSKPSKTNVIILTAATATRCITKEILRGLIIVHIEPATLHGDFALGIFLESVELLLILWGVSISYGRSSRTEENERSTSPGGKDPSPSSQCLISSRYRMNLPWRGPFARRTSFFVSCTYGTQVGCGRYSGEWFAGSRPVGLPATASGGKICGPWGKSTRCVREKSWGFVKSVRLFTGRGGRTRGREDGAG